MCASVATDRSDHSFVNKLFLSSRQEIGIEMDKVFLPFHQRIMTRTEVHADIANYIRLSVKDKLANEALHVCDSNLVTEIVDVLVEGANGMSVRKIFARQMAQHVARSSLTHFCSFIIKHTLLTCII